MLSRIVTPEKNVNRGNSDCLNSDMKVFAVVEVGSLKLRHDMNWFDVEAAMVVTARLGQKFLTAS